MHKRTSSFEQWRHRNPTVSTFPSGRFVLQGGLLLPIIVPLSLVCARNVNELHIWDWRASSLHHVLKMIIGLTLLVGPSSQMLPAAGLNLWHYPLGYQNLLIRTRAGEVARNRESVATQRGLTRAKMGEFTRPRR